MCVYLCLNSKLRGGCKRDGFCFGVWLLLAYRNMVIRRKCTSVPSSHSISCEVSHFPSCSFCQLDTLFSPKQIAGYIIRPPRFCFMVTLLSPMQHVGYILRPNWFCSMQWPWYSCTSIYWRIRINERNQKRRRTAHIHPHSQPHNPTPTRTSFHAHKHRM